jgi:hypothetical protein
MKISATMNNRTVQLTTHDIARHIIFFLPAKIGHMFYFYLYMQLILSKANEFSSEHLSSGIAWFHGQNFIDNDGPTASLG